VTNLVEQIQAAYAADQQHAGEMVSDVTELPLSYEAITDEWLTAALCREHHGARVLAHQLGAPDVGSSNRCKIHLEYNEAGQQAKLPTALFCKASHDLANRIVLGISGGAHIEVSFYNEMRPRLGIEAPYSYFARYNDHSFNSMIMLGDISEEVTEFCSHKTVMTRARAESQIRLLAELHGHCYSRQALVDAIRVLPTWPEYFMGTLAFGMKEGSEHGFLAAEEVVPASVYKRHREVWPATEASVRRHEQLPHTLAHGDVHLKNWYVAGNGEMGLSDWQCASRGHWGRDLAYTMSTALTVEDRRLWERELIELYVDRLHANGGPKVVFGEAFDHYRQQMMSALTWWTITLTPAPGLPEMQPRDITLEFIRRISTAIEDLESLDSFG